MLDRNRGQLSFLRKRMTECIPKKADDEGAPRVTLNELIETRSAGGQLWLNNCTSRVDGPSQKVCVKTVLND